jgi:aspartyl-tRNA(Asn)/glutamyl-tRNA(Gln) amidotransferase subunit A
MERTIYQTNIDLNKKKISSSELTKECLKKAKEAKNNSYISLTEDLALDQAKKADSEIAKSGTKSTLHGIPCSLKDLFITEGIRTTGASRILFNYTPTYDGYISRSLKEAGSVLIGKVNCDEFGMGSTNENSAFGPVLNPLDPSRTAGGSSGGTASSLAEGSAMFSMGTDTGGSTRLPANFCNLVGLKPTYGRVSRYGQLAYGSSLDQASPMAKTCLDVACVMEQITHNDEKDNTQAPLGSMKLVEDIAATDPTYLKGKKVAYSHELIDGLEKEVALVLRNSLSDMKSAGVELVEVDLPHIKHCVSSYYLVATSEASANLSRYDGIHYGLRITEDQDLAGTYIDSRTAGLGEEVKKRIILGCFALSSGYYDAYYKKACKIRRLISNDFHNTFQKADLFFSPVCASTAFKIGENANDPIKMYMNDLYTIPANLAGLPALAIPYSEVGGMPTGFQLIGQKFTEKELLTFGHNFKNLGEL